MSGSDAEDDEESTKRSPKKKYFPFGTPSHMHHAFSHFAHLSNDDQPFANYLAQATDIEPEVRDGSEEEKMKKIRAKRASKPNKSVPPPKKAEEEEDDPQEDIPDMEVRLLSTYQYKSIQIDKSCLLYFTPS